jgi:hypothetical protein
MKKDPLTHNLICGVVTIANGFDAQLNTHSKAHISKL